MSGRRIACALQDRGIRRLERAGLRERRRRLLADLDGDVLEIGAGGGLNLEHYPPSARLVLLEPDPGSRGRLEQAVDAAGRDARVVAGVAEALPFADSSFDAIVATLVLCSVTDLPLALGEIHRVLRPGGRLVAIEHVRGHGARAVLQDAIAPFTRLFAMCSPNRRTAELVRAAGFELVEEPFALRPAPPWVRPAFEGVAIRR